MLGWQLHNSKGRKTRTVAYGDQLRRTLVQYCKVRDGVPANTLIEIVVQPGQPLSQRGIQHIVREAVRRSGIKKRIHPHTLRHTFAVHYLNFGGSLPQLQRLLGHEHITTTLHYLKYTHLVEPPPISVLDTLLQDTFADDPKWLVAKTAATMVLHTVRLSSRRSLGANTGLTPPSPLHRTQWRTHLRWPVAITQTRQRSIPLSDRGHEESF